MQFMPCAIALEAKVPDLIAQFVVSGYHRAIFSSQSTFFILQNPAFHFLVWHSSGVGLFKTFKKINTFFGAPIASAAGVHNAHDCWEDLKYWSIVAEKWEKPKINNFVLKAKNTKFLEQVYGSLDYGDKVGS